MNSAAPCFRRGDKEADTIPLSCHRGGDYPHAMLRSELEREVAKIRRQVEIHGGYTVGCEHLRLLCPHELTVAEQFARIAHIAQPEHWSFAFQPDGSVHFGTFTNCRI